MRIEPTRQKMVNTFPEGLDPDVQEVLRDPLDRSEISRLAEWAEHPELADPLIGLLPDQKWSLRMERIFFKQQKAALRAAHAVTTTPPRVEPMGQASLAMWLV